MPDTIESVDAQLLATHEQYLRAMHRNDLADAADLWIRLNELLDVRCSIPQQRHSQ